MHWTICLLLLAFVFLVPQLACSQAHVDLVESGQTPQGEYFTYRIVGASFSATDQLKKMEELSQAANTFSAFRYDEATHICRVEIGPVGGDRSEAIIRSYLAQIVGETRLSKKDPSLWDDDDPRHGEIEQEMPNAIPEPTNPADMPDWSHLLPNSSNTNEKGDEQ